MSQFFVARFEITGTIDLGSGIFEITGTVHDDSFFGYSSADVLVGDRVVDEDSFDGTTSRWKITEIVDQTSPNLDVKVVWDDEGTADPNGPASCAGAVFRPTPNLFLSETPTLAYAKISEPLQTYIRNIDNSHIIDKIKATNIINDSGVSGYTVGDALDWLAANAGGSGYSGYSGIGTSGYSGLQGISGYSGIFGTSGYSGILGVSGYSGVEGVSGYSGIFGLSGYSGVEGTSGYSGIAGIGTSGYSGLEGISGYSGIAGVSGYSGLVGTSGYSGILGVSGYSGLSGATGGVYTQPFSGDSGYWITHNLGTQSIEVQIYDSDWKVMVPHQIQSANASSAYLLFTTNQSGYAVVMSGGGISGYSGIAGTGLGISGYSGYHARFNTNSSVWNSNIYEDDTGKLGVGKTVPDEKLDIESGAIQINSMSEPSTPAADKVKVYVTSSGSTPSREVAWKCKLEDGTEVILASLLV